MKPDSETLEMVSRGVMDCYVVVKELRPGLRHRHCFYGPGVEGEGAKLWRGQFLILTVGLDYAVHPEELATVTEQEAMIFYEDLTSGTQARMEIEDFVDEYNN